MTTEPKPDLAIVSKTPYRTVEGIGSPQHTGGEIVLTVRGISVNFGRDNSVGSTAEELAERWNLHDDLVSVLGDLFSAIGLVQLWAKGDLEETDEDAAFVRKIQATVKTALDAAKPATPEGS